MNNTTINELNTFLKGEHMAIDAYEKYIKKLNDPKIKDEFQTIQMDHKQHAIKISERIQDLGGTPVKGVGFTGKIAETMSNLKHLGENADKVIVKDAYNGENLGINIAGEIVKGDLDEMSSKMINDILEDDRNHLDVLNKLMS